MAGSSKSGFRLSFLSDLGGRAGRVALSVVLALSCVPAATFVADGEAFADEEGATAFTESDLASLSEGDSFVASVDGVDVYFTVTDEGSAAVGRDNSAGGEELAIDEDYEGALDLPVQVSDGTTTLTVTEIQSYAFGRGGVKVTAEDGDTSTEYLGCALSSVSIPATVESIDSYAFCGCMDLESVEFAADGALESIGASAFNHCLALLAADIPASVLEIDIYAFAYCPSMTELSFAEDAAIQTIGRYAFAGSESLPGALESVEFPAVDTVSKSVMQYQTSLEELSFLGESYVQIGTSAFEGCSSLESVVLPELTGGEKPNHYELMDDCFADCTNLTTVVFSADAGDWVFNHGPFSGCSSLTNLVFMGSKAELPSGNSGYGYGTGDEEDWSDQVQYFYNVSFYESEEDAEAGVDALGSARIRADATYGQIKSGDLDEDQIFDDGGFVPEAEGAWTFEDAPLDDDLLEDSCWAYDISATSLLGCTVVLNETSYVCRGSAIELDYTVSASSGEELEEGVDYAISVYLDGEEREAGSLTEEGDYTLVFEGIGDYSGSVETSFSIAWADVDWSIFAGQTLPDLAKTVSRNTTSGDDENSSFVFLVGEDSAEYALAALGAAGLKDSVILVTAQDELSEAAQTQLRRVGASDVVILGTSEDVSEEVDALLADFSTSPSVSRLAAEDLAGASALLYESFAEEGLGADGVAYVVASDDSALAAAVGVEAYENARPIFFCDADGQLDGSTRSALKTGGFERIVILGESQGIAASIKSQVGNDDISYESLVGDAAEISLELAADQVEELDGASFDLVLGSSSASGAADAAFAALYAARSGSCLLLAQDAEEAEACTEGLVAETWESVESLHFIGRRSVLPQDVVNEILSTWFDGYTRFTDVTVSSWYVSYVNEAVEDGLITGYSDEEFGPNDDITRAQVATILYRSSGQGIYTTESGRYATDTLFEDEASGIWYTAAINWCARNNILYGDGDGKVRPNDAVTREELACMLMRYAKCMDYEVDEDLLPEVEGVIDADSVSSWAESAMRWAASENLIVGYDTSSGNALEPQGTASRAQMAKLGVILHAMVSEL